MEENAAGCAVFGVGQCGVQLCSDFYHTAKLVEKQSASDNKCGWLDSDATSFWLCDTEPRVLSERSSAFAAGAHMQCVQSRGKESGSANNWGLGYFGHGPLLSNDVLEGVRKTMEKSRPSSFILLHSAGGGTGSGAGSYLCETLKEEYPEVELGSVLVLPRLSGEITMQSYNVALTVSSLMKSADAILLKSNDQAEADAKKRNENGRQPSVKELNTTLAIDLYHSLLQSEEDSMRHPLERWTDMTRARRKVLSSTFAPIIPSSFGQFETDTLTSLTTSVLTRVQRRWVVERKERGKQEEEEWKPDRAASAVVTLRGDLDEARGEKEEGVMNAAEAALYKRDMQNDRGGGESRSGRRSVHAAESTRGEITLLFDAKGKRGSKSYYSSRTSSSCFLPPRSAGCIANVRSGAELLSPFLHSALDLHSVRAFSHHYLRHGVEDDDLRDGALTLQQTLADYHI
uniref:Tubulin delta chain n=1 Tax=Palpitomonas bilix TaxID=652834 RepID=A0A7S3GAW7_9EUKA|mmetsp:Transcript_41453/g.107406  ORF Transcript_41453/g.107406 Transcript_41453/m.107406 type:complete len:458 (+) Transcript_41453:194-1567(+)